MNLKTFGKKAELTELHQQALDRLQKIASMVPGVIYQYQLRPDGSSCFPYASEAILEIYRVSPDEVREDASKVFANLHPDDLDGVAASIQASAKDLTPWQHEYRVKFSDGTIRSLYGNALPQREADGSVIWHGFITDVTDRLNAEKAAREADRLLRDNNSRMDLAMQVANMAWWEMDVATGNVTFDKRKTDMLGYSPEKFTHYKDFTDLVHPADHDRAMDAMRKHFMGAVDKYEAEYRILTRSGKYKWFYDIGSVVSWDSGGLPLYVRGLVLDITDRKQMEEELKLASVRLELAARAGGIGVWDYDIVNNILFWDNQMFELYGIEKKDFTDGYDTWKTLIHPDDLERSLQEGKNAVRGDKEYDIEFRAIWPDGSVHHIRANAVVQRNEADHSIHMIGTNWDVTELRQAEKAKLDDSENRYLSIFQGTPDGIIIADPETKMIIFANPAQCQMLGYTEEELKMMNIAAIHPEETYQQFKAEFNKQIHGEKTLPHDIQCLKKNGEIFYADISSSILDMNGRQYIVGFFRDITERREAEVAIKEALVKAESGNRLKTAFMQNISHEVRTPLNGILGFGNLLIESDLTDSEKQQYVSLLQASIDRLENTITDYLDISLIFSDNMNVSRKSVNVMQAFMSQKNKFQNLCDEKKLAFNLIIPPQNESFCIQTDPELFLKIISHFLSNAIKFTREGSITLGFSVGSGNVEFFCTDTGVGIEKEAQECIFESFVQGKSGKYPGS